MTKVWDTRGGWNRRVHHWRAGPQCIRTHNSPSPHPCALLSRLLPEWEGWLGSVELLGDGHRVWNCPPDSDPTPFSPLQVIKAAASEGRLRGKAKERLERSEEAAMKYIKV